MIQIFGIPIHNYSKKDSAKKFLLLCDKNQQSFTATPNAEILLESLKNSELNAFLKASDLNMPDTVSLIWASAVMAYKWSIPRAILELLLLPIRKRKWAKSNKKVISERVSGADVFFDICEEAKKQNKKLFFLGGMDNVSRNAALRIQNRFPGIQIVGAIAGSPRKEDEEYYVELIKKAKPEILFIGYGCPAQELWIQRNLHKCPSVKVACGIGGTFDFVSGNIKRAPMFMQKIGFEWLWRLILEPKRIKRIWKAVFVFPYMFLKSRVSS